MYKTISFLEHPHCWRMKEAQNEANWQDFQMWATRVVVIFPITKTTKKAHQKRQSTLTKKSS